MIVIIDYGSGNLRAIANIYEQLRIDYHIASTPGDVSGATKILLPGVGAFDETMSQLDKSGFRIVLDDLILRQKIPVLGICVGMQILAESSEEGSLPGLGWIKGRVRKFDKNLLANVPKVPHLGWNSVDFKQGDNPLFNAIDPEIGFYFLHSYYFDCAHPADILTRTSYGQLFASAVQRENIYGVQFHPEKSHFNGITLLKNFALM